MIKTIEDCVQAMQEVDDLLKRVNELQDMLRSLGHDKNYIQAAADPILSRMSATMEEIRAFEQLQ